MKQQPIKTPSQNNWLQYILTAFIALLPFVYSANGVDPVLIPRQIALSFIVVVLGGLFMLKRSEKIAIQSILPLLFLLLGGLYIISILQAINIIESQYITLKIGLFIAYFVIVYIGFKEQVFSIEIISRGIAISGIIAVGLAFRDMVYLQTHGVAIFSDRNMYKVNATFGHKNLLSAYIFLCLPMLAVQLLYATKWFWRAVIITGIIAMIMVVLLLQTRAVLLAFFVCFGVAVLLVIKSKILTGRQQKISVALLFCLIIGLSGVAYFFREKLSLISKTESFIERKHIWENTWQMITENPIAGVGAANWQIHFPKYGMQKFYEVNYSISEGLTNFQRPHNDFLWVWAETGLFGFIVYASIFVLGGWFAYKRFINQQETKKQILYGLVLLQIIGFVIISLVDFPLERIEHPTIMLTSIAFVAALCPRTGLAIAISKWSFLVLMVFGLCSAFVCSKRWQSEIQLKKMYRSHATGNWSNLVKEGVKAQTPYFNMDYFSIPVKWYIGVGYFMQGNLATAKQHFEEAYQLHPYQVHVLNNYGACYEKEGNHTKAIELLETSHRISPTFSDGIINLSGAYFNAGRYEDAYNTITQFGYDEDNPRFKTFAVAIIKKKFELIISQNTQLPFATFLGKLMSDDNAILAYYKTAQEKHEPLLTYLQKQPFR